LHGVRFLGNFHANATANAPILRGPGGGGRRISDWPHRNIKPRDRSTPHGARPLGSPQLQRRRVSLDAVGGSPLAESRPAWEEPRPPVCWKPLNANNMRMIKNISRFSVRSGCGRAYYRVK